MNKYRVEFEITNYCSALIEAENNEEAEDMIVDKYNNMQLELTDCVECIANAYDEEK